MAFRWRKSPCRPSLSQKNTASRGRVAQICGKSKKSEQARARRRGPAGAKAGAGAFESTGRTHIRRIYEKAEANSNLERIGLIDRYRHYRQAKSARRRNTAVFAPMHNKVSRRAHENGRFRTVAGGYNPGSREKGQKYAQ